MNYISNYYTLFRAASVLKQRALSSTLVDCCSFSKQELVFIFERDDAFFSLKVWLGDDSFIYFTEDEPRLPADRQMPFPDLAGKSLQDTFVHFQDRSIRLIFSNCMKVVITLYGRNANVLLFDNAGLIVKAFRQELKRDQNRQIADFNEMRPLTYEAFIEYGSQLGINKTIEKYFAAISDEIIDKAKIDLSSYESAWKGIVFLSEYLHDSTLYIIENESNANIKSGIRLDYFKDNENKCLAESKDIIIALKEYAKAYFKALNAIKWRAAVLKDLDVKIKKVKKAIASGLVHLDALDKDKNYRHQADLIMANLHEIPKGSDLIKVKDFYQDRDIEIKLNPRISPQAWAEKLYRKAKNQEIEYTIAFEKLEENEKLAQDLDAEYKIVLETDDIKGLKEKTKSTPEAIISKEAIPFRKITYEGYDIYIGKNATVNDKLTFGFAHKEDLWLHARGVSGSHIVVKHKRKAETFPEPVIERAAELAAFYSKAKTSAMVPVAYTLKKYVRKPKGAAPGAVIMEKESVIIVEPRA